MAKIARKLGGIVDEGLRVFRVQGLRFAGAGIMPILPCAATQLTAYAIK